VDEISAAIVDGKNPSPYNEPDGFRRPFRKGNPGKPKGALAKRTIRQIELLELLAAGNGKKLKPRVKRLTELLLSKDESIRLETEKFLASYEWSRPKMTIEVQGSVAIAAMILSVHAHVKNGNGNGASRAPRQ
jgi:hypothetical protein